ncbi:electron transfer flavoprotein subunit alpha, partial [Collinsella aerofaciens]
MSGLIIDSEACIGCGRCVRACASGGIVVEGERPNRCARVTDGCILCGGCVDACPVNAISIERDEAVGTVDLDAYRDIWVFVQTDEHDTVAPVAYELMGKGRELADARGCRLVALVGVSPESSLEELEHLVCAGADEVLACRDERLRQNDAEVYARLICDLVAERKPEAILYGATAFGRELAPGVAVRLQTGLTADCTVLSMDTETGLLQQTRPAFGGNLMATIVCPHHRPQMATVRPGIFKAPDFDYGRSGTITQVALAEDVKARVEISIPAEEWGQQPSIANAERLVVVGRGIGSKKNLPLMRRLAEALGAELGCTRPVVEAGWLEYRHQIGQTGVSVSPRLLV